LILSCVIIMMYINVIDETLLTGVLIYLDC